MMAKKPSGENLKNNSLRRIEVKRRAKVIEVFPQENAVQKILYLLSVEMNERYSKKTLKYLELVKDTLIKMREERYVRKEEKQK